MAQWLMTLASGALFGLGLVISGMVNPAKVIGFLDVAGQWDPTLALVMGGALAVTIPGFRLMKRLGRPWCAQRFVLPTRQDLDGRLIGGAAIFGIGWGLAGICPGPGILALLSGLTPVHGFIGAMLLGMFAHSLIFERAKAQGGRS
ncbi:DUF6691 family protein [Alkalilimnicola sp. S0819]|uniref:DUF6691 family protein n=1 Tax=Alkalilimnicola sp. S0819 TaxID=2613922 RepID=UPI001261FB51|nr:DUF6691 family protein [Alkalilimnicola sp. S0819]KAB7628147.1 YeeE/YedE family protein [Alkalilimnicola sp. S0819]MPQ15033.1 YeeE/YedE family protein [Alkalilimnicola sp. S0819]